MKRATRIAVGAASLAVVLAVQGVRAGQSNGPTVYGQLRLSIDQLDNGANSALNVSSNKSRLGVKGDIPVSADLTAIYQIESEINADTGDLASGNTAFASRNTFAGLRGAFGTLRAGRFDTPVKELNATTALFWNEVGDTRNLTRGTDANAQFDERVNNSIGYTSPTWSGLSGSLQYSTNTDDKATGTDRNSLASAVVSYASGPAFLGVGYERHGLASGTAGSDPHVVRVAGYYDIGALRITGLWQSIAGTTSAGDEDTYGAGLRYVIGPWAFKTEVYQLDATGTGKDATLAAVGTEYALAKAVTLYADIATVDNRAKQKLTPYKEGRTDNLAVTTAGSTASAFSVGTTIKF